MNFSFQTPDGGQYMGRLWATGRYGFSLPKKVEITTPDGATHTYLYANKRMGPQRELANRAIIRIAIGQFLTAGAPPGGAAAPGVADIDPDAAPYAGQLTSVRPTLPRTPLRVRPGKLHARQPTACEPG